MVFLMEGVFKKKLVRIRVDGLICTIVKREMTTIFVCISISESHMYGNSLLPALQEIKQTPGQ
jgi:hypothetical protein